MEGKSELITGLVGNKIDIPEDEKKIDMEAGAELYDKLKFDFFVQTSAKSGFGIEDLFLEVASLLETNKKVPRRSTNKPRVTLTNFGDKDTHR